MCIRDRCRVCPRGHACAAGSLEPTPCLPGSHAPTEGLGTCILCPAGSFQSSSGKSECIVCGLGRLCLIGASLELPAACAPGTFGDMTDGDGSP
eukprot:1630886-Rhodomonas_salina.1